MVRRIIVRRGRDTAEVSLDNPVLAQGWWEVEWMNGWPCRWTDGDALLSGVDAGVLEVELACTMRYPVESRAQIREAA
jgi:hypothetical protein